MNRCDECQHWVDLDHWEARDIGFGQCMAVRERWKIQDGASEDVSWDADENGVFITKRREALRNARAYVQDGSEYRAELMTGPDFGCVLWQKKEAAE